jgi:hypothetical protein
MPPNPYRPPAPYAAPAVGATPMPPLSAGATSGGTQIDLGY